MSTGFACGNLGFNPLQLMVPGALVGVPPPPEVLKDPYQITEARSLVMKEEN